MSVSQEWFGDGFRGSMGGIFWADESELCNPRFIFLFIAAMEVEFSPFLPGISLRMAISMSSLLVVTLI